MLGNLVKCHFRLIFGRQKPFYQGKFGFFCMTATLSDVLKLFIIRIIYFEWHSNQSIRSFTWWMEESSSVNIRQKISDSALIKPSYRKDVPQPTLNFVLNKKSHAKPVWSSGLTLLNKKSFLFLRKKIFIISKFVMVNSYL